jgi:uncharacterized membrane protein YozB (DUF420 family)
LDSADPLSALPPLNAALNALAATLLLRGRRLARAGAVAAHRRTMLAAFVVSSLFLASYVAHKASRHFENTPFHAEGALKAFYLGLLATHVVLAMAVPVLAIALIVLATRGRIASHRRLARVAWPIWMYVSLSGVAIYGMLYHLNPKPSPAASNPAFGLDRGAPKLLLPRAADSLVPAPIIASERPIPDRGSPASRARGARDEREQ